MSIHLPPPNTPPPKGKKWRKTMPNVSLSNPAQFGQTAVQVINFTTLFNDLITEAYKRLEEEGEIDLTALKDLLK